MFLRANNALLLCRQFQHFSYTQQGKFDYTEIYLKNRGCFKLEFISEICTRGAVRYSIWRRNGHLCSEFSSETPINRWKVMAIISDAWCKQFLRVVPIKNNKIFREDLRSLRIGLSIIKFKRKWRSFIRRASNCSYEFHHERSLKALLWSDDETRLLRFSYRTNSKPL